MDNVKIEIYYDDNKRNFYVKKLSGGQEQLPSSFIDFRPSHKKTLSVAYPHKREHIMNCLIADEDIEKMITEFNNDAVSSQITRWYKLDRSKLKLIGDEPKGAILAAEYEGEETFEDIFNFIVSIKENLLKVSYAVFECPKCKKRQYHSIKNDKYVECPDCKESFDIYDEQLIVVKGKFDSIDTAQNEANAIDCLKRWKKEETIDFEQGSTGSNPFYYSGNVYRISFNDCKSLHHELYKSFAYTEIFTTSTTRVTFTDAYKNYLKSLKTYKVNSVLYDGLKGVENRINSQEYALLPIEKAFYWYMNKYCIEQEKKLIWKINNQLVCFNNRREFIEDILSADEKRRKQLIRIYENVSTLDLDFAFFDRCDGSLISLSYMIYKETGLFVYITGDKLINFGNSFIESLHEFDDLIPFRNAFIESIRTDCLSFWEEIKGDFDDYADFYTDSIDGTYYDRLCFYQYVINGKKEIRYKDIVISDSVQGFKHIKDIICDAYMSKDDRDLAMYACLVELLKNSMLWDDCNRFIRIKEARTSQITNNTNGGILTFNDLRDLIVNERGDEPSITLYLRCIDASSKSIAKTRFWYKNKLSTLLEHIRRLIDYGESRTVSSEVRQFYKNSDVVCVINEIFNKTKEGGVSKFNEEQEKAFAVLIRETERLNKELEEQRKKVASEEIKGNRRSSATPPRTSRTSSDTSNNSSTRKQTKAEKKEDDDDEWS